MRAHTDVPRWLSPDRARRIGYALIVSVIASILILLFSDRDRESSVLRGDFPAFWSMSVIARTGAGEKLYDIELQTRVQNEAWPSMRGTVLPAAYPPCAAFFAQPLAWCSPGVARALWTIGSLLLFIFAARRLASLNPDLQVRPSDTVVALALFAPITLGVVGGQLVGGLIFLFALVLSSARSRGVLSDLCLGLSVGLLFLKPYYGVAMLVPLILSRRWLGVATAVLVVGILSLVSARVSGPRWFGLWYSFVQWFATINFKDNWHQMPNMWAGGHALALHAGMVDLSLLGIGVLGGLLAFLCRRSLVGAIMRDLPERAYASPYILSMCFVILAIPQTNFYDLGLMAAAATVMFRPTARSDRLIALVIGVMALIGAYERSHAGVPYFFGVALVLCGYIVTRLRISEQREPRHHHCAL